ncbi:sensor histidine kinase [Planctomonas sp. JC2975]|uniref:ATP-binding protein n=1 Tax=Planctomonas sp. JC2975 TaxID=2729626 RepID=UPI001475D6C2|nr:sensor histidine kinase [Planctomonas sp. JC2975]NNC10627.1 sensor histidine kinase [Planctomonas sp. JC2975]
MSAASASTSRLGPGVVAYGPYVVLVLASIFTIMTVAPTPAKTAQLVLLGAAIAWMLLAYTLRPAGRRSVRAMAVFVTVLLAIFTSLVFFAPWYGVLAVAGYIYSFAVVPWPWRLLSVSVCAVLAGTAQASAVPKNTVAGLLVYAAVVALNVVALCLFAWIYWRAGVQSEQRRVALEENERLREQVVSQAREAGIQAERQRMAGELHDTVAQGLVGIVTQLEAAAQVPPDSSDHARHLDAATRLARSSLVEARRTMLALDPDASSRVSLAKALESAVDEWAGMHSVRADYTATGSERALSDDAEHALLRVVQESLSNVAKHAGASRVGVTLTYLDDRVLVDVRDDGIGFDPGSGIERDPLEGGYGLSAMRNRIRQLGGLVEIESEPGRGTALSVALPVDPTDQTLTEVPHQAGEGSAHDV